MRSYHLFCCFFFALLFLIGCSFAPTDNKGSGAQTIRPLATVELPGDPEALAVSGARGVAAVGIGSRVQLVDLVSHELTYPTLAGGAFYGIDVLDDLIAIISPATGLTRGWLSYPVSTQPPYSGHVAGMTASADGTMLYFVDNVNNGSATSLHSLDLRTYEFTAIGSPGMGAGVSVAYGLARHPTTGTLYTITATDYLFEIDASTGQATAVGPLTGCSDIQAITFTPDGTLYGINDVVPASLVKIDISTGAPTLIDTIGLHPTFGSLTATPDGTLWAVGLGYDRLYHIDPRNADIIEIFPSLKVPVVFGSGYYFQSINGLTYIGSPPSPGIVKRNNTIHGIVFTDSGLAASTVSNIQSFDSSLVPLGGILTISGLKDLEPLVYSPGRGRIFTIDKLSGTGYSIDIATMTLTREYDYRTAVSSSSSTYSNHLAWDESTGRLFIRDETGLIVLAVETGDTTMPLDFKPEGVIIDQSARRLFATSVVPGRIIAFDLDSYEELGHDDIGNQVHYMAVDTTHHLLATSNRVSTSFSTEIFFYDTKTFQRLDSKIVLEEGNSSNAIHARLGFDTVREQLVVARHAESPIVEFYPSPR